MEFEWDDQKRLSNLEKHGLDFLEAAEVFQGPVFARSDQGHEYGEERWKGIGQLRGYVVVIVWTVRLEDMIRIISLRKAVKHEKDAFAKAVTDRLGKSR